MAFEIKYIFHPRLEDGPGYNTEVREEKVVRIGKSFEETPLEKCAATIMAQLARRDIWVIDVEVNELVKRPVSFKEAKDGKGIILKNRRFSLNSTAQMVAEDVLELAPAPMPVQAPQIHPSSNIQHPHEAMNQRQPLGPSAEDLYNNPNMTSVRSAVDPRSINKNKTIYWVYFEPDIYTAEAKALKLKFQEDRKYPVHQIIPSATGSLSGQKIAVSDDTGQVVILDEKFFAAAGQGLLGDAELGFSKSSPRRNSSKLMYEDDMVMDAPSGNGHGIPLDDGSIPADLLEAPDIRAGQRRI